MLLLAILCSLLVGVGLPVSPFWPGVLFWIAGGVLFARLSLIQRSQTLVMFGLGGLAAVAGLVRDADPALLWRALYANQSLIAMLGAVAFLRLVTRVDAEVRPLPRGRPALWRTLLGVHLFGAVINMSALVIVGDRLARRGRLNRLQAQLLSRGFSLAAHWSPFFVAMGVALTQAPGSRLATLSLVGLVPAGLGLLIAGWGLSRQRGAERLRGYPVAFGALWVPLLLAAGVLVLRYPWPDISVITLVSLLSLLVTVVLLFWRLGLAAWATLRQQIVVELPRMAGELVLFLSAGVLSVGIAVLVDGWQLQLDMIRFDAPAAAMLLWLMVGLAVLGVHPLISIATASGLLGPVPDPNLLALVFLMAWALGVAASPLSGMHMALQGRYGIPAHRFVGWNGRYILAMLLLDSAVLFGYQALF
ncbi:hypothetical protein [Motiliproteus sediminis]|uniref:hypothetical protein n=1 Tax=Motiliproteus sediminis TaxID=1468178 RepID=UPI001AEF8B84|nr:hypothetical protein [Motiliproteus sediminis]